MSAQQARLVATLKDVATKLQVFLSVRHAQSVLLVRLVVTALPATATASVPKTGRPRAKAVEQGPSRATTGVPVYLAQSYRVWRSAHSGSPAKTAPVRTLKLTMPEQVALHVLLGHSRIRQRRPGACRAQATNIPPLDSAGTAASSWIQAIFHAHHALPAMVL